MNRLTSVITSVMPGLTSRRRHGSAGMLAIGFYAVMVTVLIRHRHLAGLTPADLSAVWATVMLLYVGALLAPATGRTGILGRQLPMTTLFRVGLGVALALGCAAALAPLLAPGDPLAIENASQTRFLAPSGSHPLGTDRFGRDIWARILYGARASIGIGVLSVSLAVTFGTFFGAVSGMAGRWIDDAMMRIVDALLAFPRLLLVLVLVALFSNSYGLLVLTIASTGWMGIARLVRGEVIRLRQRDFVTAAVASGVGQTRLIVRHLLPNAAGPVIVAATLNIGAVILLESYLSFLGIGVQPPMPSWGAMVFEGRSALSVAWWVPAFPAIAITVSVVAFNAIGDGLRDALERRR